MVKISNKVNMRKKGWIRIVEAFTAILLVTGVLLVVFGNDSKNEDVSSKRIFEQQQGILRHVELNNSLRDDVLSFDPQDLPKGIEDFPERLRNAIGAKTPGYLDCDAKICALGSECVSSSGSTGDVYSQKAVIGSSLGSYSPRELKLFCSLR